MNSYVAIKTFFDSSDKRDFKELGKLYNDKNLLYKSVKDLLLNHITPSDFRDKKILLKPNFVKQNESEWDKICLFTHPNLILETLHVILECAPKSIVVGDAPIQDCHWEKMLHKEFYDAVDKLSKEYNIPISVRDFRKVIFDSTTNTFGKSTRTDDDYLIFDVGDKSWLEPITEENNKFRVTNYDPDRMKLSHAKGMHRYCVAREVFDADIVITMPKTKTHRMACLTNSLKILVGMNGDKDYLPHHRIGAKDQGGDCYKDHSLLRTLAEKLMDFANRHRGYFFFLPIRFLVGILWRISMPNKGESMAATWYGNDTVWRMVLDLNLIATYGKSDGTMSEIPQRTLYTLCDAIVGGQNEGPLYPEPLATGVLFFSNDPYLSDEVAGNLLKLNLDRIPLLAQSKKINSKKDYSIFIDGEIVNMEDVRNIGIEAIVPLGWSDYNQDDN